MRNPGCKGRIKTVHIQRKIHRPIKNNLVCPVDLFHFDYLYAEPLSLLALVAGQ